MAILTHLYSGILFCDRVVGHTVTNLSRDQAAPAIGFGRVLGAFVQLGAEPHFWRFAIGPFEIRESGRTAGFLAGKGD